MLSARFIAGIGHGLSYVTVVQHFGEICDDGVRGSFGTMLHLFLLKGGMVSGSAVIKFFSVEGRMDPNRFLGIFSLVLSFIAIGMIFLFFKESPVALIEIGKNDEAIKTLMILKGESEVTDEITKKFNDAQVVVFEDKQNNSGLFTNGNIRPLLIVTLTRICFVLTFNYALKYLHFKLLHSSNSNFDFTFIMNTIHTATTVIVTFTIDKGRRFHFILSAFGTSISLIFLGIVNASFPDLFAMIIFLFVAFECLSAIGLGLTAQIFSTEAFPLSKKAKSIAFTAFIENCLQIAFIYCLQKNSSSFDFVFLLCSGLCLAMIASYLFFKLPETKGISILKAQKRFLSSEKIFE